MLAATLAALALAFVLAHALDVHTALALCHDESPLVEFGPKKQTAPKPFAL